MRTRTQTLYSAAELRDHDRDAFDRAWERYRASVYRNPAWAEEHRQSLDAVLAAVGKEPPRIDGPTRAHDVRRCLAWLENNVLGPLRVRRRARYTKVGAVPSCPFTGYCADDDLLDVLKEAAREGRSPHEWPRLLRDESERLWERDVEDQAREDAFVESADANGWEFDEQGRMAR